MNIMNFVMADAMGRRSDASDEDRRRAGLIAAFMPNIAVGILGAKTVYDNAEAQAESDALDRAAAIAAAEKAKAAAAIKAAEAKQDEAVKATAEIAAATSKSVDDLKASIEANISELNTKIVELQRQLTELGIKASGGQGQTQSAPKAPQKA